jgi:hypothetical protein
MFNINTLVDTLGRIYDLKKGRIVKAMKTDRDETWKQRGQRFEVFRPSTKTLNPPSGTLHSTPFSTLWYFSGSVEEGGSKTRLPRTFGGLSNPQNM